MRHKVRSMLGVIIIASVYRSHHVHFLLFQNRGSVLTMNNGDKIHSITCGYGQNE